MLLLKIETCCNILDIIMTLAPQQVKFPCPNCFSFFIVMNPILKNLTLSWNSGKYLNFSFGPENP